MQLNEITFDGVQPISGYGPGFFRVGAQVVAGPVLITATGARDWGGYEDAGTLLALKGQIDVLFFGTGPETRHIPEPLRAQLEEAGLGVEAMNSPGVCRTYNVLLSEGRRVAAALLPV